MACVKDRTYESCPDRFFRYAPAAEIHFRTEWWRHFVRLVGTWIERRRQRRALSELDADRLRDIGVSPAKARAEAEKPFWRE